jgi:Ca2+-binding RTX toxin-like protein
VGSFTINAQDGNDTITVGDKSGAFTDVIDGGSGTDSLSISFSGVASLGSFTSISFDSSSTFFKVVDTNGGTIQFKGIENLSVGDFAYTRVLTSRNTQEQAFFNSTEKVVYLFNDGTTGGSLERTVFDTSGPAINVLPGLNRADNITIVGSSGNDSMSLDINRISDFSGNLSLTMGSGNDTLNSARLQNGDSVDMGIGDDTVALIADQGSIGILSLSKLDGGAGTDTLDFSTLSDPGLTLSLKSAGATNFENIIGTSQRDVITGDAGANTLDGNSENDTIVGLGGNDALFGGIGTDTFTGGAGSDAFNVETSDASSTTTADVIKDFSVSQSDTITLLESTFPLANSSLRGDGTKFQSADFKGGTALGTNTGFLVNSGANSTDLEISTIISELNAGDSENPLTANDSFFYVTDNGTNSGVFKFSDQNGNADVDSGEVVAIAILENVSDATVIFVTQTTDFVI